MSGTIAQLGIAVDSGDAVQAATDLDKMTAAGVKAEKASEGVSSGFEKATASARTQRQELDALLGKIDPLTKKLNDLAAQEDKLNQARNSGLIGADAYDAYQKKIEDSFNALAGLNTVQKQSGETADAAKARIQQLVVTQDSLAASVIQGTAAAAAAEVVSRQVTDSAFAEIGVISQLEKAMSGNIDNIESLIQAEGLLERARKLGLVTAEEQATYQVALGNSYDKIEKAEAKELAQKQRLIDAEDRHTAALQRTVNGIDPVTAKLAKLEAQEKALNQLYESGHVDADKYSAALAKIGTDRAGLTQTAGAVDGLSLGTKQARENVLQLGNALAEGNMRIAAHNILEIATNAGASALRFAALAAPVLAVAAALGLVAYAYSAGSQEQDAYNKSLILTGNYAGTSAGQLADMARQVSATVGTTGAAAAALASLAGTGKIASGSFEEITEAAISMEKATGKSVDATIAEFVKIADDPVAAAKSLNDQYHFLTASVYSQILALKEQGDTIGATKLLTDTYASTVQQRAGQITQNLGLIEKGWKGIKDAAAGALDATLNIGRQETLQQQADALKKRLADPTSYSTLPDLSNYDGQDSSKTGSTKKQDQGSLDFLQLQIDAEKALNSYVGERARIEKDGNDAIDRADARHLSNLSNAEKRALDIKKIYEDTEKIRAANPDDKRVAPAYVAQQIKDASDKYKDPKGPNQLDLTGFNNAQNSLKSIQDTYSNTEKELESAQKAGLISQASYSEQRASLIEQEAAEVQNAYKTEVAALEAIKDKSSTTAEQRISLDQKIADARTAMVKAQKDADSQQEVLATAEKGRLDKQTYSVNQYVQALSQQQKALELAGQRAVLGVGQGDKQNALNGQLNSQQDRFAQQSLDLENQRSDPSRNMSPEEFQQKTVALAAANQKATDQIRKNYADVQDAQGDWTNGATSAYANYLDTAKDVAGQTKSLFTNAFDSMDDAITNFALTGKLSFSDFAKSIISDLARIAERQASSAILSSLFGIGVNALAGSAGGSAAAGASQTGYSGDLSGFVPGRASGGSVDPNTLYQVNEKGPELFSQGGRSYLMTGADGGSVTPLTTGGGPGVAASNAGSGSGSSIQVNAPVTVTTQDRSSEGLQLDQQALQKNMAAQMKAAAERAVADSWVAGGISYRNASGRR
ncbi:MAG: tail protein [Pseudomonas sp.]|nr:tail protein [Pseudomonas sp.]